MNDKVFRQRFWEYEPPRAEDERDEYHRDKSRIIHSSGFRRLQAKTQVMGVGEGDFHRTRLTHSIEVSQIGEGLLASIREREAGAREALEWLPPNDLLVAACLAHDLGHPPFGHSGERALHTRMVDSGGFEGNGQTLRIVTRLEKYKERKGMNPTRRLILALLKYPAPYSKFDKSCFLAKPPKCYFDTEKEIVKWALDKPFLSGEVEQFVSNGVSNGKPIHRTLDCSIMEVADDIAYAVHDLEDVVARRMVQRDEVVHHLKKVFREYGPTIGDEEKSVCIKDFKKNLFRDSFSRKELVGKLVHLFVTSCSLKAKEEFSHPLLKYHVTFDKPTFELLKKLKNLTYDLVIKQAEIQQLERRGQRIIEKLFDEFISAPTKVIPESAWNSLNEDDHINRRVCDYIAGMTDSYAEKIYGRLFIPGSGTSRDEL